MRPVVILVMLVALAVTACEQGAEQGGAVGLAALPPGTELPTTTSTVAEPTTTEPTTVDLASVEEAAALITPTGVVVAVLGLDRRGFWVTTPCGGEAVVSSGRPIGEIEVVIDPGHGGQVDTGAVGRNGLREAVLNLELSRAIAERLARRAVSAVLTRTGDYATRLDVRAGLADALEAKLLVSIHHNAPTPGSSPRPGTEVYVQSGSVEARRLGGLVWEEVVGALSRFEVRWAAAPDAGVLTVLSSRGSDAYGMLREPETVSVLVEMAYISNPEEAELLASDEYVAAASEAVAGAIEAYLRTDSTGAGWVSQPRVFNPLPGISRSRCEDPVLEYRAREAA